MFKILQARIQQYVNCELPDVQAGFRKGRRTRDQIAKSTGSWKKQESSRKTSISALLTMMPKPLTVWITINCGKFLKRWEYQTTWPAYRFLKRQVRWSGIPISFRIFQFVVIHTVKGFGLVNKAEIDVFSGNLSLFQWSNGCWQFDFWFLCLV